MKAKLVILMSIMGLIVISPTLSVLAKEGASGGDTLAEHTVGHTSEHQEHQEHAGEPAEELTEEQHAHEEHAKHDEPIAHEKNIEHDEHQVEHAEQGEHKEHGKHAEVGQIAENEEHGEQGGHEEHKEYPKLAKGVHKIAYIAIGFITFVLIAVPIGAYLEKKKHPSHH